MKRILFLLLGTGAALLLLQEAAAQKAQKPVKTVQPARLPEVGVTLGRSGLQGGGISKRAFDSLVSQGLRLPGAGTIVGFDFTYAERTMYEDSAGNPLRVTDYFTEYCFGDTLSSGVKSGLFDRTKPGDTATFDRIKVLLPNGTEARGKAMRFVLTR